MFDGIFSNFSHFYITGLSSKWLTTRALLLGHFSIFFSLAVLLVRGRTGEPGEHVMDRTVGWYAYGNMSWLLYLKLEPGSPDDISELNRPSGFLNLATCPSLSWVMVTWFLASGWPAASHLSPVDSGDQTSWFPYLYIPVLCCSLLLYHILSSFIGRVWRLRRVYSSLSPQVSPYFTLTLQGGPEIDSHQL